MNLILSALAFKYHGDFQQMLKGLKNKEVFNDTYLRDVVKTLEAQQVGTITILDDDYPENLKTVNNPPMVIFYQGNRELLKKPGLIVFGQSEIAKEDLKKFDNLQQALISLETDGKWISQMRKFGYPIISVTNQEISNDQLQKTDLILSLVPPQLNHSVSIDWDDRQTHEHQSINLALGLSPQPLVRIDTQDLEGWKDIDIMSIIQDKDWYWIKDYQPKGKARQSKKQLSK